MLQPQATNHVKTLRWEGRGGSWRCLASKVSIRLAAAGGRKGHRQGISPVLQVSSSLSGDFVKHAEFCPMTV